VSSVIHSLAEVRAVEVWIEKLMTKTRPMDARVGKRRDTIEGIARDCTDAVSSFVHGNMKTGRDAFGVTVIA
jgi:hypothetical protein